MNAPHVAAVALADQIERLGSYFGFAAVIGLGVLSLLYFAQAREVKRLREWAGRSPERDAELAQRVQADAQRRVVAQPIPAARPVVPPASPQTAAAQQADAARKAAAAAVMEKFQQPGSAAGAPTVGPPGQLDRPASPATAAAAAATATPDVGATTPPAAPESGDAPATATPSPTSAPTAAPAVPSAATAGAAAVAARQAGPPARTPPFTNGAGGQDTHESAAARPDPLPSLPPRPPRTPASLPSRHDEADDGRSGGPRIGMIVGGGAAAIAVCVVLVMVLTGGSDTPPADNEIGGVTPPPAAQPSSAATRVDRKATQVAVLNGTTQTGLARNVGNKLEGSGFTILSVGDNSDQQIATTTISYSDGNERAARVVAQIMDVPTTAVKPIDINTAAAVAPEAKVVVIVGSDRSNTG